MKIPFVALAVLLPLSSNLGAPPATVTTTATTPAVPEAPPVAKSAAEAYALGRKAFYDGNLPLAEAYLRDSAKRNPQHIPTQALLAQIAASKDTNPGNALKDSLAKVTLKIIQFDDTDVPTALEALKNLYLKQGGANFNFIVKGSEAAERKVTLKLTNVTMVDALKLLAETGGLDLKFDTHAVLVTVAPSAKP